MPSAAHTRLMPDSEGKAKSLYLRKRRLTDRSLSLRLIEALRLPPEDTERAKETLAQGSDRTGVCSQAPGIAAGELATFPVSGERTELCKSLTPSFALSELVLSSNRLTTLPDTMELLAPTLRYLNLAANAFSQFPPVLKKLSRLHCLVLSRNRLAGEMPEDLPQSLRELRVFRLCGNFLTGLPKTLSSFTRLRTLMLGSVFGGNRLTAFPENSIQHMCDLRELDLSHNLLTTLPKDVGHPRSRMQSLSASDNRLERLPQSIGLCTHLTSLNLARNFLTSLPCEIVDLASLQTLDLSENLLCVLPGDILNFMKRTTLLLAGNPFTRDPGCQGSYVARKIHEASAGQATCGSQDSLDDIGHSLSRTGSGSLSSMLWLRTSKAIIEYERDDEEELSGEQDAHENLESFLARRWRDPTLFASVERYHTPDLEDTSTTLRPDKPSQMQLLTYQAIAPPTNPGEDSYSHPGVARASNHRFSVPSTLRYSPSMTHARYNGNDLRSAHSSWSAISMDQIGHVMPTPPTAWEEDDTAAFRSLRARPSAHAWKSAGGTSTTPAPEHLEHGPFRRVTSMRRPSLALFPSLRELAARVVLGSGIPVNVDSISTTVHAYIQAGARPCSLCRRPYVKEWISCVQVGRFGGHASVPRRVRYCSAKCWTRGIARQVEPEGGSSRSCLQHNSVSGSQAKLPISPRASLGHLAPQFSLSEATSRDDNDNVTPSQGTARQSPYQTPCTSCPQVPSCPAVSDTPARWRLQYYPAKLRPSPLSPTRSTSPGRADTDSAAESG